MSSTTIAINSRGQISVESVLTGGASWSSPTIDDTKSLAVLVDSGGSFERTVDAVLSDPVVDIAVSTTSTSNDTATATFAATGDDRDHPEHNDVHTGESVELAENLTSGLFSDGSNDSPSVSSGTSLTNNSSYDQPTPLAMWAFAPKQVYTGDIVVWVDAFSRYGINDVEVTLSDGSNTITKSATSRTTVDLGTRHFITNNCDLYEITFTSAEISSNSIADGDAFLTFVATANNGETRTADATSPSQTNPRQWPIRLDQSGTYSSNLPVAYVDQRSSITTGALSGGSLISKGERIEAPTAGGDTAIGVVTEDYAGSGTLRFVQINPHLDNGTFFENGQTITAYTRGTSTATGVTTTAMADASRMFTGGTLGDDTDPFGDIDDASKSVANQNSSNGYGKQPAGVYKMQSPWTAWGNDDFSFNSGLVDATSWMEIEVADGFSSDDVFYLGPGGSGSSRTINDSNNWIRFKGEWNFYQLEEYTPPNDTFIGFGSTDPNAVMLDDMFLDVVGENVRMTVSNIQGMFINNLTARDGSTGNSANMQSIANAAGTDKDQWGLIVRGYHYDIPDSITGDASDFFQNQGKIHILFLNNRVDRAQGSAAGQHYDTFQSTIVGGGNSIVHNFIDRNNRYQHTFFGQGISDGWAHVNVLAEIADDGDIGSSTLSLGNTDPEPLNHFIVAHCTFLDESRSDAIGNSGDIARNAVFQNCYATGYSPGLASQENFLPRPRVGATNCHFRDASGGLGVRGTGANEDITILFSNPTDNNGAYPSTADDSGYMAASGGSLNNRLLAKDDIHGLLTDVFGNPISYDGTGAVGAAQASGSDTTNPTINSAEILSNGTTLRVSFSESMDQGVASPADGWSISGNTISSASFNSATELDLTLGTTVEQGASVSDLNYTESSGNHQDTSGNVLQDATQSVTNNSTQDLTSPSISNVSLGESSGNIDFSFDSNEQLGIATSDIAVTVDGPTSGADIYSFDRDDFTESGAGPYTYTLSIAQAYDDGDGQYTSVVDTAQDGAGNDGAQGESDNYTFDGTPPSISGNPVIDSAGTSLTITFDESTTRGSGYSDSDFTLNATDGNSSLTYSSGDGTSSFVYDIGRIIGSHETVTLDYTQPGDGLEDSSGNDVNSFSGQSVANNSTQDIVAPTITSAEIFSNGTTLRVTFDEDMDQGVANPDNGFSISGNTISSGSFNSATELDLTLGTTVGQGDSVSDLNYTSESGNHQDTSGNTLGDATQSVTNNSTQDITDPQLSGAPSVDSSGTSLTINFSESVSLGSGHSSSDFTVNTTDTNPTISISSGDGTSTHVYTISRTIGSHETVTLDYTQPGDGLEDAAGNDLSSFSGQAVTNNSTQDTVAPTINSAEILSNGTTLRVTFNEDMDQGVVSPADGWSISGNTISSAVFNNSTELDLTLGTTVGQGASVSDLNYAEASGNHQDTNGNALQDATQSVTNNSTQDITDPQLSGLPSISAAGTTISISFSESVTTGSGHSDSDFTLNATDGNPSLSLSSGDGTSTHNYTINRTIGSHETVTLDYSQPGNGLEDAAGNDLASFSGQAVTNNSTQDIVAPVLSNPSASVTGGDTANISVDTDTQEGTLYAVVTTSSTKPTKSQIKSGDSHTGADASFANSQSISSTGTKTFNATGLSSETTYYAHFMHEDSSSNQSSVETTPSFTTDDVTAPVLSNPSGSSSGSSTATLSVSTNEGDGTLYVVVTISGTAPSPSQVKNGKTNVGTPAAFSDAKNISSAGTKTFNATGLSSSTTFYAHFMHEDSSNNQSSVVSSSTFTTNSSQDLGGQPSVISGNTYQVIATHYADARGSVLSSIDYLFDAVYTVVQMGSIQPEVDLLAEFWNTYQINTDLLSNPAGFASTVRRLNNHVINRSSFTNLDDWLNNEGVVVPQAWADLSGFVGFDISNDHII